MALSEHADLLIRLNAQNNATKAFGQLSGQLDGLMNTAKRVAGVVAAAFALREVIDATQRWGVELDSLHDTLGLSGADAAAWNYQARIVGTTADDIATAFGQLTNKIGNSIPAIQQHTSDFDKWGISVLNAKNQLRPSVEILDQVRNRVNALGPGLAARQLEMDLFGRSGGKLHDFLALDSEALQQMKQDLENLGLPTTTDEMEAQQRQANRLGLIFDSLKIRLGSFLIPVLLSFGNVISRVSGLVKSLGESFRVPLGIIKEAWDRIRGFLADIKEKGIWDAVSSLATDMISKVGELLGNVGDWAAKNLPIWKDELGKLFDGMVDWIKNTGWPKLVEGIESGAGKISGWIEKALPSWIKGGEGLASDFVEWWITRGLPSIIQGFGTGTTQVGQWLVNAVGWMASVALPASIGRLIYIGAGIIEGILKGLGDIAADAGMPKWFLDSIGWISNVGVPAIAQTLTAISNAIIKGLISGNLFAGLWSWITDALGAVKDTLLTGKTPTISVGPGGVKIGGPPSTTQPDSGTWIGAPRTPAAQSLPAVPGVTGGSYSPPVAAFLGQYVSLASGGVVPARPGGTMARIGEGGVDEAVVPLDRFGGMGTTITNYFTIQGSVLTERDLARVVGDYLMQGVRGQRNFSI